MRGLLFLWTGWVPARGAHRKKEPLIPPLVGSPDARISDPDGGVVLDESPWQTA